MSAHLFAEIKGINYRNKRLANLRIPPIVNRHNKNTLWNLLSMKAKLNQIALKFTIGGVMKKRIPNARPVVKKHLERLGKFNWSKEFKDPRSRINMDWDFNYLMNTVFYGMLTGMKNLREVEDFSESYHERVPDTTLYFLLSKIDPEPLRLLVSRGVKRAFRDHELPKESFPIRIAAVDGKCGSISKMPVGSFSQKLECNNTVMYVNRVLRAAHISNDTKLLLGQREIHGKTNEMGEFIPFMKDLLSMYGTMGLLEVISVDAGMISLDNANYLVKNGLDYIMALKSPQKNLVTLAHELLEKREQCDIETVEYMNGKQITRQLFRCKAPEYPGWSHLEQFWRIRQEVISNGETTTEDRYFVTSLAYDKLTDVQVLKAIRMHWGIENNANWIFDTAWKEDDSPWCNRAFVFVTLLRMLAYNIISRLKNRRLRTKNDRARSWKGILLLVYSVLIEMKNGIILKPFVNACNE